MAVAALAVAVAVVAALTAISESLGALEVAQAMVVASADHQLRHMAAALEALLPLLLMAADHLMVVDTVVVVVDPTETHLEAAAANPGGRWSFNDASASFLPFLWTIQGR